MKNEMRPLVAVVTGSSSGIGRQTAIELAGLGFYVLLHARRNLVGLQQTARLILEMPPTLNLTGKAADSDCQSVRCLTADISDPAACSALVSAAFAWYGRVDVWVNNAGADLLTTEEKTMSFDERLELLLKVDLQGTIRLSRKVAASMRRQPEGGWLPSIINIGWDQAELGMEGDAGQLFCSTKAAVAAFSRALAMSAAPGVRVNCVAPGWIKTAWGSQHASDYWDRRARGESLLNRWGVVEDVARAIVWLASSEAEFINGQVIAVNGGRRFPI